MRSIKNSQKLFLKLISTVVAVTFLWTNCVWASGLDYIGSELSSNTLAAQTQTGPLLDGQMHSRIEDAEALNLFVSLGATDNEDLSKLLVSNPEVEWVIMDGNYYLFCPDLENSDEYACYSFKNGEKAYYRTTSSENVTDAIGLLLDKLDIEKKSVKGAVIPVTLDSKPHHQTSHTIVPEQTGFINSILRIMYGEDACVDDTDFTVTISESSLAKPTPPKPREKLSTKPNRSIIRRLILVLSIILSSLIVIPIISACSGLQHIRQDSALRAAMEGDPSVVPFLISLLDDSRTSSRDRADSAGALLAILVRDPDLSNIYEANLGPEYEGILRTHFLIGEILVAGNFNSPSCEQIVELGPTFFPIVREAYSYYHVDLNRYTIDIGKIAELLLRMLYEHPELEDQYIEVFGDGYRGELSAYYLLAYVLWGSEGEIGIAT